MRSFYSSIICELLGLLCDQAGLDLRSTARALHQRSKVH